MHEPSAHERLYQALRRRLRENASFPAGRIVPLQLADEFRTSVTPVREALFRLAGERLVALHPDGGFAEMELDATRLADLHAWNGHHLLAALHLLSEDVVASVLERFAGPPPGRHPGVVDKVERLFVEIGRATGNAEFLTQIETANDHLRPARLAEERIFPDASRELGTMVRRVVSDAKSNVRRRVHAYHRRRVEYAGQIASLLAGG